MPNIGGASSMIPTDCRRIASRSMSARQFWSGSDSMPSLRWSVYDQISVGALCQHVVCENVDQHEFHRI